MQENRYLIQQIDITDFRNYESLRFRPSEGFNILFGANGAGKTNLMEAISLLVPGRGLRSAIREDFARFTAEGAKADWGIVAQIYDGQQSIKAATGVTNFSRRDVFINKEKHRQSDLSRFFNAVWLTPAQDRLFVEGGSGRRRFLDRLVFGMDAAHAGRINAYEKAMRQRARLLATNSSDSDWLSAIEDSMVRYGIAIAAARSDILSRLSAYTKKQQGLFPQASLSLKGDVDDWLLELAAIDCEDRYREMLYIDRKKDRDAAMTHTGPHRSDMVVFHAQKQQPAHLCSTGEQKALLISLILADCHMQGAERGIKPVLLLDEITAHLDPHRRKSLFEELKALDIQVFMTGTEKDLFEILDKKDCFWHIEDNHITAKD